jgi:hypothetical protein
MVNVEELLREPTENESMEHYAKVSMACSTCRNGDGKGVFA